MRTRSPVRTVPRKFYLPELLVAQVELTLYSDAQGRIPYGAWAQLLVPLLEAYLSNLRKADDNGPTNS